MKTERNIRFTEMKTIDYFISEFKLLLVFIFTIILSMAAYSQKRQMEYLTRGLLAVDDTNGIFLGWRIFATDSSDVAFNIYRNDTLVNETPINGKSNYIDSNGTINSIYYLETIYDSVTTDISTPIFVWENSYLTIPLQQPPGGKTPPFINYPDGQDYTYTPNDCSVADLDGDGNYEIIVKWEPTNARDNSQEGITGKVYLDAYKMNGTFLWRIDLGINIRAGAHYTQFMVYDLNGDGKAEVACKTAPGTMDGTGKYLSDGPAAADDDVADYRTVGGWPGFIIEGPEYLTVFDGNTGAEITTVFYVPDRYPTNGWGKTSDNTNRVDRFLACVAYFDSIPSLVMCRGYYGRSVLAAWDFNGDSLTQRWVFDSNNGYLMYGGQGAHSISVGDVDNDGYDEIMYGAMAIDHDGSPLYNTLFCHGDATHLGDFIPSNPGLEFYMPSESAGWNHDGVINPKVHIRNAATGEVLVRINGEGDIGRAMIDDISDAHPGCEFWSAGDGNVYNSSGSSISTSRPPINFAVWWDGDLLREMLDGNTVSKWGTGNLISASGCSSNNDTKSTPALSGDIIGDWREEVIFRTLDNQSLRIYTTTTPTQYGLYALMQDPQYRLAITWQNVGYNQPPHPGFFLGHDMSTPPVPDIKPMDPDSMPALHITYPQNGFELGLGLDLMVIVNAIGLSDLNSMIVIADDETPIDTITNAPNYKNIKGLTTGTYSLVASGYDKKGNLIKSPPVEITVDEGYPHVIITSPENNKVFEPEDSILITVNAWDTDGTVDSVALLLNDSQITTLLDLPYSVKIENPGKGVYNLKALAYDNDLKLTQSDIVYFDIGKSVIIQESVYGYCGFINHSGSIDSNHEGYTGSGFANSENITGADLNWAIHFRETGNYMFTWRYATESVRPANLLIDDVVVANMAFENTGAWATWKTISVTAHADEKTSKVTLKATGDEGLPNIDYIRIFAIETQSIFTANCDNVIISVNEMQGSDLDKGFIVYPVPANGYVNIMLNDVSDLINSISIFNLNGIKLKTINNILNNSSAINVDDLSDGLYIMRINTGKTTHVYKLYIKN